MFECQLQRIIGIKLGRMQMTTPLSISRMKSAVWTGTGLVQGQIQWSSYEIVTRRLRDVPSLSISLPSPLPSSLPFPFLHITFSSIPYHPFRPFLLEGRRSYGIWGNAVSSPSLVRG